MSQPSQLRELVARIGKTGLFQTESLRVPVTILDVKMAYGEGRYQVAPVGGTGTQWVAARRVTLTGETA